MAKKSKEKTKPKAAGMMTEVAVENLTSMMGRKADVDEVLRQAGLSRQRLSVLMTDDEISQAMETRLDAVVNAPWRLIEDHGEQTQFLIEQIKYWHNEIVSGAWEACPYGYSVMEAVYAQLDDGKIIIKELQVKPLEWFEPKNDGRLIYRNNLNLNVNGVDVYRAYPYKFFLTRRKPTYKQPYGDPLLSKLYWSWFFRTNTTKFWVKFLERFGSPLLVGKVGGQSRVQEDIDAMTSALLNAHAQAVVSIGAEDSIETVGTSASGSGSSAFEAFDTVLTRRIQKVVLGQTLTSGTDGTGSRALGQVHENVRQDKRNSDLRMITPTFQGIVDAICLLNGFEKHTIVLGGEQDLKMEVVDRDLKLKDLGVQFTETYIQEVHGLKPEHFKMTNAQLDQTPKQFTALPQQALRFAAKPNKVDKDQAEIDELADSQSFKLLDNQQLKELIFKSESPEELANHLMHMIPNATKQQFNAQLDEALYAAAVFGVIASSGG